MELVEEQDVQAVAPLERHLVAEVHRAKPVLEQAVQAVAPLELLVVAALV
jgi:hypothetical protein